MSNAVLSCSQTSGKAKPFPLINSFKHTYKAQIRDDRLWHKKISKRGNVKMNHTTLLHQTNVPIFMY